MNIYPDTENRTPGHSPYRIKINHFERGKGVAGAEYDIYYKKNDTLMSVSKQDKDFKNPVKFDSKTNVFGKYNNEVIDFSKSAIRIATDSFKNGMNPDKVAYEIAKGIPEVDVYRNANAKEGKFKIKEESYEITNNVELIRIGE